MANRTWSVTSDVEDEEESDTRKGPWTVEEDRQLIEYIRLHGEGRWNSLAKAAGLKRTGRSCRLRWVNSLRPDLKRSKITPEEERLIIELHGRWGNRWSRIARRLKGRTDNEIKNYWRTRIKGKLNLQVESGSSSSMNADNREHLQRSIGPYCLPNLSQRPAGLDSAELSTSFPPQNTEEIAVQKHQNTYLQNHISQQVIPRRDENYESGLQGEIDGPQINDYVQSGAALQEHFQGAGNQSFENNLPYSISVGSLLSLQYSCDFYADCATHDGTIPPPSSYMVASPEAFSGSEAGLNRYSDVLWHMDEDDDRSISSKYSAFRNDKRQY